MRSTTSLTFLSLALLSGLTAAAPKPTEKCEPLIKCVDAVNACGVRYGGCYDVCKEEDRPVAPLCNGEPGTTTKVLTPKPTKTTPPKPTIPKPTKSSTPKPSTPKPSTPKPSTPKPSTAKPSTPKPSTPKPSIPKPSTAKPSTAKPSTTSEPAVVTTAITVIVPPTKTATTTTLSTSTCNGNGGMVCIDHINPCGATYGGCFKDCKPWPTFTSPPCTKTGKDKIVLATPTPL